MKKLFTLVLTMLFSVGLWATATNFHNFVAAGDTIIDLEGTGSSPSAKFTAVNNTDWAAVSTSTKNNSIYRMDPATEVIETSKTNKYGTKLGSSTKATFKVTGVSNVIFYVGTGTASRTAKLDVTPSGEEKITEATSVTLSNKDNAYKMVYALNASKSYTLEAYADADIFCYAVKFTVAEKCTDPEASFSLASDAAFVGDAVAMTFSSSNPNAVAYSVEKNGAAAEASDYTIADGKFTANAAGEFVVTATQEADATYCAVEESDTITISAKEPCTTLTIDGPANAVIGQEITLTLTGFDATPTEIHWYDGNFDEIVAAQNQTSYTFTASKKGEITIQATAWNEFNTENEDEAYNYIIINVTKLCGELIKATYDPSSKTSTVTGVVGGTADRNTQDNGKLGSNGHYYGVKLASGSFMAGDVVTVVASALSGGNTATLYADKTGTTFLDSAAFNTETLTATITLPSSADAVYLYRVNGNICNPNIESLSVSRSCEDSNDASVKSLTVNGEAVAKDAEANKFEYTVSTNYAEEYVTVAFTIHPLATSDKAGNTFTIPTPAAGDTNGASFKVTAEDGTEVTYTVFISKSASLSDDATLKVLSVEGFTLAPAFDPAVVEYTITKAYSAALPDASKVTATANDANATVNVAYNELVENEILVQVLAEDGETANTYSIKVLSAAAKKDLLEASFSNGANGYIKDGNIKVPYLYGTEEPTFVAAKFWNAEGEPSAAVVDGQLVVTGVDASVEKYTIEYVAVTPMEASYDLITFTEVPSYIYSIYGWDADKGIKFSKDVEEASKKRISEGQDRIYIALPAAESVILTGGSTGARPIKVTVNGVVDEKVTSTPKNGETVTIALSKSTANFIGIESNGNSGDAGFTKMQLVKGTATAIDNTETAVKAQKVLRDGQLYIIYNGKTYNVQGAAVK